MIIIIMIITMILVTVKIKVIYRGQHKTVDILKN